MEIYAEFLSGHNLKGDQWNGIVNFAMLDIRTMYTVLISAGNLNLQMVWFICIIGISCGQRSHNKLDFEFSALKQTISFFVVQSLGHFHIRWMGTAILQYDM